MDSHASEMNGIFSKYCMYCVPSERVEDVRLCGQISVLNCASYNRFPGWGLSASMDIEQWNSHKYLLSELRMRATQCTGRRDGVPPPKYTVSRGRGAAGASVGR